MKQRKWAVMQYLGGKVPSKKLGVIRHSGEDPENLAMAMYGRRPGLYLLLVEE